MNAVNKLLWLCKKFQKNPVRMILSLVLLLNFQGCQVLEVGVPGVFGLLSYPFTRLVEAFEDSVDDFYEDTEKARARDEKEDRLRLILNCREQLGEEALAGLEGLDEALALRQCLGCRPWGAYNCPSDANCCTQQCSNSCERLCPRTFDIMPHSRERAIPYRENVMPIGNSASDFGNPIVFGGYCHGLSSVRSSLGALALFEPTEVPRRNGVEITDEESKQEFYRGLLDDITAGNATKIPGFSNIMEFTSDPMVQPHLEQVVRRSFTEQNFYNPFMLESAAIWDSLDSDEFESELRKVGRHIEASGSAQITLNTSGLAGHTVEVYHTFDDTIAGRPVTQLCITDFNASLTTYQTQAQFQATATAGEVYCPRTITVYKDDYTFTYDGQTSTGSFHVDRHADRMLNRNIDSLVSLCKEERGCD